MERHDRLWKFVGILTSGCTDSGNITGGKLKAARALVSPTTSQNAAVMDGKGEGALGKIKFDCPFAADARAIVNRERAKYLFFI